MANTSSIIALVHGVRAYFALIGVTANVTACGWKQRTEILNQGPGGANRVSFMPSALPGGDFAAAGELGRMTNRAAGTTRQLLSWRRQCAVSIWGVDTSDPTNEELQIAAVETLFEQTVQAMHNATDPTTGAALGVGNIEWGAVSYSTAETEAAFGREILVEFVHNAVIYDRDIQTTTPQPAIHRAPFTT